MFLKKNGDVERVYYTARNQATGVSANLNCYAILPDGSKQNYSNAVQELNGGNDPVTRGVYYADITLTQEGKWLVIFNGNSPSLTQRHIKVLYVDTPARTAMNIISDGTLVQNVDNILTTEHGTGSWQSDTLNSAPTVGGPPDD